MLLGMATKTRLRLVRTSSRSRPAGSAMYQPNPPRQIRSCCRQRQVAPRRIDAGPDWQAQIVAPDALHAFDALGRVVDHGHAHALLRQDDVVDPADARHAVGGASSTEAMSYAGAGAPENR